MARLINREVLVFPTIIFVVLSVLSNAAVSGTIESAIYVHPNDSSCSELLNSTTNCSTLACYTQEENIRKYFTSNTKMVFLSGVHRLCGHPQISSIQNFTMVASVDATFANNEGVPEPHSIIECQYGGGAGFHFSDSSNIQLHGLKFDSCGANFSIRNFQVMCALCFERIHNVSITQLVTNSTTGFGIHFDNSYRNINIHDSAFLHSHYNSDQPCQTQDCTRSGNAHFYFSHDHGVSCPDGTTFLTIKSSWFMYGNDKSPFDKTNNSPGLTIFIRCSLIYIYIDNIIAANNTGEYGANIALSLTDSFENPSQVCINNSRIANGTAHVKGGGLRIWSYYAAPLGKNVTNFTCSFIKHRIVSVINTKFVGNQAITSAGAVYIDHYEALRADCIWREILFYNCSFTHNFIASNNNSNKYEMRGGAAFKILRFMDRGYIMHTTPQLAVTLNRSNFSHNYILGYNKQEGAIVDIFWMGYVKIVDCDFLNNNGTALSIRRSNVIFNGSIHFINNSAAYGGALKLCDSSLLYLENNTKAYFIGNQANFTGGAIYAEQPCLDTVPACFFQVIVPVNTPIKSLKNVIKLVFENNSATIAGDAIYGGAIEFCYTYQRLKSGKSPSYFHITSLFKTIFNLTGQTGISKVSSNPYGICLCTNNKPDCDNNSIVISVYAGQIFNISVVAVGQMNGASPAYISASLINGTEQSHMLVAQNAHVHPAYHHYHYNCTRIKYSLLSNRRHGSIHFSLLMFGSSDIRSTHDHIPYPTVSVSIKPCPWGFALTPAPPYKCDCDPLIQKYVVRCNINTHTILVDGHSFLWIGSQSHSVNNSNDTDLVLVLDCDSQHCNMKPQNITLSTIDYQCLSGHTGVMCKSCCPGYTLALGTSNCLKDCSNKNAAWLLILCLLSGILLVVILLACNLTVTEGTINGLIFYANIVHLNHDIFFHQRGNAIGNFFGIFIAWLNLDFGFEVCFYKHLDAYQKVWLQFGFVLYIWIVQLFIVILSRNFIFFTRLVGRNVIKVMATLFLLCYAKVIRYIIFTFEYAVLYDSRSHHSQTAVWFHDGSVEYLKGKHIPLFVVAIFLSLLMTFFTLVMLFIQFLQKQTEYRCLRWINRLRPFFDANTGSCKDHYRFWPGLLYFMRASLNILNSIARAISTQRINIIMPGTMAACIMILIVACVTPRGVYKKWPLNILEFFFFLNLFILCLSRLIIHNFAVLYSSISITMLTFVGILIYHTYKEFKTSRVRRALVNWNTRRQLRLNQTINNDTGALRCQVEVANDIVGQESDSEASDEQKANEATPLLRQEMPPVIRFDQYREPLIEGTND